MPTISEIIDKEIKIEGGVSNDPTDAGGRTAYGISEKANPQAWAHGTPTEAEARAIYEQKYVRGPGFNKITDSQLQFQLIDYGVNSGPAIAIQKLQAILGVKADGIIGPHTLEALQLSEIRSTNNALVAARVEMIGKIVTSNPSQLKYLNGWLNRALQFLK